MAIILSNNKFHLDIPNTSSISNAVSPSRATCLEPSRTGHDVINVNRPAQAMVAIFFHLLSHSYHSIYLYRLLILLNSNRQMNFAM